MCAPVLVISTRAPLCPCGSVPVYVQNYWWGATLPVFCVLIKLIGVIKNTFKKEEKSADNLK